MGEGRREQKDEDKDRHQPTNTKHFLEGNMSKDRTVEERLESLETALQSLEEEFAILRGELTRRGPTSSKVKTVAHTGGKTLNDRGRQILKIMKARPSMRLTQGAICLEMGLGTYAPQLSKSMGFLVSEGYVIRHDDGAFDLTDKGRRAV